MRRIRWSANGSSAPACYQCEVEERKESDAQVYWAVACCESSLWCGLRVLISKWVLAG